LIPEIEAVVAQDYYSDASRKNARYSVDVPAEDEGFRSVSFLKKAFATVGHLIGLNKKVTPRGMRRTFNDVMRLAKVEAVVTKSISGHQTDRMREHYSTVTPDEQLRSIGNVVSLFGPPKSGEGGGEGTPASGEGKQEARGT
jgi:integrase